MNTKRLEQIVIEDSYSRSDMRKKILKDISNGEQEALTLAVEALKGYFHASYYESKNARLDAYERVCGLCLEDLVLEVSIIILPETAPVSYQSVVGRLAEVLGYPDIWDGVKTAAEIIAVVCQSDLYDIIAARNSETGSLMIVSNYSLELETKQKIARMKYLPPMICEPMTVNYNNQSHYLGKDESVLLGKDNHHNMTLGLDALNLASQVALSLDEWILTQEEVSKKPLDTKDKADSFYRMRETSKVVYAELVARGNEFYFGWKFDKRGRMYSSGYEVNIQSTEYKKALINLANKQIIRRDP